MIQNLTIRSLLIGAACTAYVMLSASSSASQKRQEEDPASGQLVFNNACRTCHIPGVRGRVAVAESRRETASKIVGLRRARSISGSGRGPSALV
jgi:hypothetical protein